MIDKTIKTVKIVKSRNKNLGLSGSSELKTLIQRKAEIAGMTCSKLVSYALTHYIDDAVSKIIEERKKKNEQYFKTILDKRSTNRTKADF